MRLNLDWWLSIKFSYNRSWWNRPLPTFIYLCQLCDGVTKVNQMGCISVAHLHLSVIVSMVTVGLKLSRTMDTACYGNCYFFVEVSRLFHSVIKFVIWGTSKQNLQKQISVWINIREGELHMNNMSFLAGKFSVMKDMFSLTWFWLFTCDLGSAIVSYKIFDIYFHKQ
jgi:hypothetical protein